MAEAVHQALVEVIAKAGKIDLDKAKVVVARMKEEGRYAQDIFGQ
jgi:sulfite reductase alpha subunit-like flavoprotein